MKFEFLLKQDEIRIIWIPLGEAVKYLWKTNRKLHDLGGIAESIAEHGFRNFPFFDIAIKAFITGNGRIQALAYMKKDPATWNLPKNIILDEETGDWIIPVIVGVTSETPLDAAAYAIDSHNTMMGGGDFTGSDMARLYDRAGLIETLTEIYSKGGRVVTVSGDDLDAILLPGSKPAPKKRSRIIIQVTSEMKEDFEELLEGFEGESRTEKFEKLVEYLKEEIHG